MIERTPMLIAVAAAVLTLSACGDRAAAPGSAGASDMASEEPIDAVPLPLDEDPLSPPPVIAPAATVANKTATTDEEAASATPSVSTETPTGAVEAVAKPPRVVVAPREPARPVERPAPSVAPEKGSERPVLDF